MIQQSSCELVFATSRGSIHMQLYTEGRLVEGTAKILQMRVSLVRETSFLILFDIFP